MATTIHAAARFEERVKHREASGMSTREAVNLTSVEDREGAEAYRLHGLSLDALPTSTSEPIISLSVKAGETFDELCERTARERQIPLRDAIRLVGIARRDLAESR